MTDQSRRESAGKCKVRGFGADLLFAVVVVGVVGDRARRIEKDIVRSPIARGVDAQSELIARR